MKRRITLLAILILICTNYSVAEDKTQRNINALDELTITTDKATLKEIPGSAYYLNEESLAAKNNTAGDINRILRDVPGVNLQEEEGYGLRPNIGLRGTPSERSANITLMEDGILVAPAPYAAPSAYYFPTAGRMKGVEVLKGAGQIKYGPYTTGGSINLLSTPIPKKDNFDTTLAVGNDSTKKIYTTFGKSFEQGGFMLETWQFETDGFKELPGGENTGFDLEDYSAKFRINTPSDETDVRQALELKLQSSDQSSNDTYLGISQEDFNENPFQRYAASQLDNINVEHSQVYLTHKLETSKQVSLTNTLYYNETKRDWYKLQSVRGASLAGVFRNPSANDLNLGILKGLASEDDALTLRSNAREYESKGWQSVGVARLNHTILDKELEHEIEIGLRYHKDEEDRFQFEDKYRMDNGKLVLTSKGSPGSQANRIGSAEAWALSVQDKISADRLTLTPGFRFETIDYNRADFGKNDAERNGLSLAENDTSINSFVPGLGLSYEFHTLLTGFAGIHKGFSPPGPQSKDGVKEEESVNFEIGARSELDSFATQLVLFFNDYDNLLGEDTLSGGGEGTGDLFNAGSVKIYGLEFEVAYDLSNELNYETVSLPARLAYTYTNAEFDSSFDSDFFGLVSSGDKLPYVPEHQLSLSLGVEQENWLLRADASFMDSMTTAAGEAGLASSDKTDSYFVTDLTGEFEIRENTRLFATIENLSDEEYVVARRPAGARPGRPITFISGVKFDF